MADEQLVPRIVRQEPKQPSGDGKNKKLFLMVLIMFIAALLVVIYFVGRRLA